MLRIMSFLGISSTPLGTGIWAPKKRVRRGQDEDTHPACQTGHYDVTYLGQEFPETENQVGNEFLFHRDVHTVERGLTRRESARYYPRPIARENGDFLFLSPLPSRTIPNPAIIIHLIFL